MGSSEDTAVEAIRRQWFAENNAHRAEREALEAREGQVWSTQELQLEYDVIGFAAPLVVVRRKSDGKKGSLQFQHQPRLYWGWEEHKD